jgi:pyoverdine/dityrosine biosynthesis protein Dit1
MNSQNAFSFSQSLIYNSQYIAKNILRMLFERGNFLPAGHESESCRSLFYNQHIESLQKIIRAHAPIHFILPAFPAKSPNQQKTLGHLPDYGEVLALKRLNDLCKEIGNFYSHGAFITICSDGRVFNDLVEASDEAVDQYAQKIRKILEEQQLKNIFTYSLDDAYITASDYSSMRTWLVDNFAEPLSHLKERVRTENDTKSLFNGIHRFLLEDQLVLHPQFSKNKLREYSKKLSYAVIQRSNAWSRLLESIFPDTVRLSIHPQPIACKKIGIRLLDSQDIWRTPWHSVPLFNGDSYSLVSRREAEAKGAQLTYIESKYPCYSI